MLNELELRKPGFQDGHKVKLTDNQEWTFPKAKFRFLPKVLPDGTVEVGGGPSFGPAEDKLLEILFGVIEADGFERLRAKFQMAVRLLLHNYDLQPVDFEQLLVVDPDSEENAAIWEQLTPVLTGSAPKKVLDAISA